MIRSDSGQAITEYILITAIVVSIAAAVFQFVRDSKLQEKLVAPIGEKFGRAYKFGHPQAKGFEDGDPEKHPRISTPGNFRLFINPRTNR